MNKQLIFTTNLLFLLVGLSFASRELKSPVASQTSALNSNHSDINKIRLIERLDQAAFHQKIYQRRYGHFSQRLEDLGLNLSKDDSVEIHLLKVNDPHFTLTGSLKDEPAQASIQEDYILKANFLIPDPSSHYLRLVAMRQLDASSFFEESAFKGYFRYTNGIAEGLAVGVKPPVLGITLHAGSSEKEIDLEKRFVAQAAHPHLQEETIFAQAIYRRQTGHYATQWSELMEAVSFPYVHNELYDLRNTFPFLFPYQAATQKPLVIEQIL